jgi:uncharacterized protein
MRLKGKKFFYSASDLSGYIHCRHLTTLNKKAVLAEIQKPEQESRLIETLQLRGQEFEKDQLTKLKRQRKTIAVIEQSSKSPFEDTLKAMKKGFDVIYQARMEMGEWQGWADFLIRVEKPSKLGKWSYEVYDTKLASTTKAGTILQISLYTEIVSTIQGVTADEMHVWTPKGKESFRVNEYSAYYRLIKRKFLESVSGPSDTYPDPVSHCDICIWWKVCNKVRRDDDHLRFVAGLGNSHLRELRSQGIDTLEQFANTTLPIPFKPNRGSVITYAKLREQARLQLQSRNERRPVYELLPREPGYGLFNLPEPHEDDIFLDLEGDPMVSPSGREYIFGWYYNSKYYIQWAESDDQEKKSFEKFIKLAIKLHKSKPGMHIYHFGAYETSAFKRLMCKYATQVENVDILLRAGAFVDLHGIVKHTLRAGVEKYSLKDLEKYHGYLREADLRSVAPHKAEYEYLLETDRPNEATPQMKKVIATYNQDDCISTNYLFDWLCAIRQELRNTGEDIPPPEPKTGDAGEKYTDHQLKVKPIFDALLKDMPETKAERTDEQQVKYLVAHMLDWYGRELKKSYWEKFRLEELSEDELFEENAAIAEMKFTGERSIIKTSVIDTYSFSDQQTDIRTYDNVIFHTFDGYATVVSVDKSNNLVCLKKSEKYADIHPRAIFKSNIVKAEKKVKRIVDLGMVVAEYGIKAPFPKAGIDLLLRRSPRIKGKLEKDKTMQIGWLEWLLKLNNSVLPMQGPPGTGKTWNGSELVLNLILAGKKIGVTALSHSVITGFLKSISKKADEQGLEVKMIQKVSEGRADKPWRMTTDSDELKRKIPKMDVIAGTTFMWADDDLMESVDYLFVDEAGQLSLVDTLACAFTAKNLVLLGDPQQLKQPQQGVHPEGTEVSALEHILGDRKTIDIDKGVFLGVTQRMHPSICHFVSEMFYEGRLEAYAPNKKQKISGNTYYKEAGLFYHQVDHEGNMNYSVEEVDVVEKVFKELTKGDVFFTDKSGKTFPLTRKDVMIVSPYNAQVYEIQSRLGLEEGVGTVDKFQGREAPVVIYSMATSSAEDAPRGMDFLYSPNRFNVAVSRAQAIFILVAAPAVFEPECKSPEQMKLANSFCHFLEGV